MSQPTLELADVLRRFTEMCELDALSLTSLQRRALHDILNCRTAALGGHLEQCNQCGHQQIAYNSCRNRHCPKCQAAARAAWLDEQAANLLPVEYFHVVFTLPEPLAALALQNKRVIYGLLFQAAAETLLEIAADPRHLGAQIGFLAVLHTWGQTLQHHPHLHCVVPGGGLAPQQAKWVACRSGFFLPVKVLSRLFRRKFLEALRPLLIEGKLVCAGQFRSLAQRTQTEIWLRALGRQEWVVYAKPPFGGPEQVLKYLARYTHRVAISNQRLLKLTDEEVTFRYKDYAADNQTKTMTLTVAEFTRRFLQHVLPRGFVRIRHYGFLANRCRRERLALCRRFLAVANDNNINDDSKTSLHSDLAATDATSVSAQPFFRCPVCQRGLMVRLESLPLAAPNQAVALVFQADSS